MPAHIFAGRDDRRRELPFLNKPTRTAEDAEGAEEKQNEEKQNWT